MNTKKPDITPDYVARLITLTFGKMSNSQPYWCFLAVKPSRYAQWQKVASSKTFDINNFVRDGYGEIVVSGEGLLPPNDIIKKVSAMSGVPIRDFFREVDVDDVIAKEIERVKKELGEA